MFVGVVRVIFIGGTTGISDVRDYENYVSLIGNAIGFIIAKWCKFFSRFYFTISKAKPTHSLKLLLRQLKIYGFILST